MIEANPTITRKIAAIDGPSTATSFFSDEDLRCEFDPCVLTYAMEFVDSLEFAFASEPIGCWKRKQDREELSNKYPEQE